MGMSKKATETKREWKSLRLRAITCKFDHGVAPWVGSRMAKDRKQT